jgi:hypothetical protein
MNSEGLNTSIMRGCDVYAATCIATDIHTKKHVEESCIEDSLACCVVYLSEFYDEIDNGSCNMEFRWILFLGVHIDLRELCMHNGQIGLWRYPVSVYEIVSE